MHPKFKFQNGGRIENVHLSKVVELEILNNFYFWRFSTSLENLNFKTDGNSVILGEQYTTTAPPPVSFLRPSRRARGRPRLRACTSWSLRVVPSLSWPRYKAPTPSSAFLSLLCFSTLPSQLRRAPLDSAAQASLGKVVL